MSLPSFLSVHTKLPHLRIQCLSCSRVTWRLALFGFGFWNKEQDSFQVFSLFLKGVGIWKWGLGGPLILGAIPLCVAWAL